MSTAAADFSTAHPSHAAADAAAFTKPYRGLLLLLLLLYCNTATAASATVRA